MQHSVVPTSEGKEEKKNHCKHNTTPLSYVDDYTEKVLQDAKKYHNRKGNIVKVNIVVCGRLSVLILETGTKS